MFKTNEYFEGKVKSIAYENEGGQFTIGVMADGDYEFGTSSNEAMTVVDGTLVALLPAILAGISQSRCSKNARYR